MEFEEWWNFSKFKSFKNKYLAKKGWLGALEYGAINTPDEILKRIEEIKHLKNQIEKLKSAQKIDRSSLLITREEPNISDFVQWIKWWREMRKGNGLSFTMKEAVDVHEELIQNISLKLKNIKKYRL